MQESRRRPVLTNRRVTILAAVALVLLLLVIFVADNFGLVEVQLLTLGFRVRLAWALLIAFGLGGLLGFGCRHFWRS